MSNNSPEQSIFESENVKITNLRAIIESKTYAMANITSVSLTEDNPSTALPFTLVIGGIIFLLIAIFNLINTSAKTGWGGLLIGLIALAVGVIILRGSSPTYVVKIGSSSGETNVLSSTNKGYIEKIVAAMNEAIVRRG